MNTYSGCGGKVRRLCALALAIAAMTIGWTAKANAEQFDLTLTGEFWQPESLGPTGGTLTPFNTATPFSFNAVFDSSTTNLVAGKPWPGFVAYQPTSLTLTVAGNTYQVQTYNAATRPNGLAVAIFDYTTPFGKPGTGPGAETPGTTPNGYHPGIGLIQDPFHDGAGFTSDFLGSTPTLHIATNGLKPVTFTGSYAIGFGSGVCLSGCRTPSEVDATTPTPLTLDGVPYQLVWGSEDVTFGTANGAQSDPTDPRITDGFGVTAVLAQVPEPGSLPLVGAMLALLAVTRRMSRARG